MALRLMAGQACGGNPEAARIAGVPMTLIKLAAYMMSGLAAAAMIVMGRLGAAEPTMGTLWDLDALRNGLTLMNVQAFYPLLAMGIIIIVAMLIDEMISKKEV